MAGQESRIAPAFFVALIVLVTCVGATLDADLTQNRPGEVQRITSIEAFEKDVLTSSDVWVVVFTSTTKDEVPPRASMTGQLFLLHAVLLTTAAACRV
jgi:hypothetical protein